MSGTALALLLAWCGSCAWQDLHQQRISNRLTYPALGLALGWLLLFGMSLTGETPLSALGAFALALAFGVPGQRRGLFGGGDIKLLMALGCATGTLTLLYTLAAAALALALWALLTPRLRGLQSFLQRYAPGMAPGQQRLAYAPFSFIGLCFALWLVP